MRLTWNEVRARAANFADEWQNAHYEKGETQSFYNAFFRIFGKDRKAVARYEMSVARTGRAKGFIDLFWPRTLIVEQKSKGRDLFKAEQQAVDYLTDIADHEQPRYILVSDFQTFKLTDLDTRETTALTGACHVYPLDLSELFNRDFRGADGIRAWNVHTMLRRKR